MIGRRFVLLLGLAFLPQLSASDDLSSLQRLHEQQAMRLEQEQAQYRRGLEDLPLGEQRDLTARLSRQQRELQQLQEQQRRRWLTRPPTVSPTPDPHPAPSTRLQQFRIEQQRQLFRFGLERQTWPYPAK